LALRLHQRGIDLGGHRHRGRQRIELEVRRVLGTATGDQLEFLATFSRPARHCTYLPSVSLIAEQYTSVTS
jgi:hypothetical protein